MTEAKTNNTSSRLTSGRLLARNTVLNLIGHGLPLAVAFPIYLHFLGYEKYGVWLVLAIVLSFAQLGNLGIGQAVMKLVAEEHRHSDSRERPHVGI